MLAPRRILLLQPRWLGDVLLCTPAVREARRAFPDARIDFVTERAGGETLRGNAYLDRILVDEGTVRSRLRLLRTIAASGYDAVVDFRSTGSTAQLAWVSRAPLRVGIRGRGPRNAVYTHLAERISLDQYAARHKLDLLRFLGITVDRVTDLSLDLAVGADDHDRAERIWRDLGLVGAVVVAMTPVSREAYKQWDPARWAAVADTVQRAGFRVLLTHAPGERDRVGAVAQRMTTDPVWEYDTLGIAALGALLARCRLWVGNDGGAKHLAAAVGLPTVAVSRWRIGPVWTDPTAPALQEYLDRPPIQGCELRCERCPHRGCLEALSSEAVTERVLWHLQAYAPPTG